MILVLYDETLPNSMRLYSSRRCIDNFSWSDSKISVSDYVLNDFNEDEQEHLEKITIWINIKEYTYKIKDKNDKYNIKWNRT